MSGSTMLQLNPAIPVITPHGEGLAHFIIDYGLSHDLMWVCHHDDGKIMTFNCNDIRGQSVLTFNVNRSPIRQL